MHVALPGMLLNKTCLAGVERCLFMSLNTSHYMISQFTLVMQKLGYGLRNGVIVEHLSIGESPSLYFTPISQQSVNKAHGNDELFSKN